MGGGGENAQAHEDLTLRPLRLWGRSLLPPSYDPRVYVTFKAKHLERDDLLWNVRLAVGGSTHCLSTISTDTFFVTQHSGFCHLPSE